jgi:hypothetical protein
MMALSDVFAVDYEADGSERVRPVSGRFAAAVIRSGCMIRIEVDALVISQP